MYPAHNVTRPNMQIWHGSADTTGVRHSVPAHLTASEWFGLLKGSASNSEGGSGGDFA